MRRTHGSECLHSHAHVWQWIEVLLCEVKDKPECKEVVATARFPMVTRATGFCSRSRPQVSQLVRIGKCALLGWHAPRREELCKQRPRLWLALQQVPYTPRQHAIGQINVRRVVVDISDWAYIAAKSFVAQKLVRMPPQPKHLLPLLKLIRCNCAVTRTQAVEMLPHLLIGASHEQLRIAAAHCDQRLVSLLPSRS